MKLKSKEVYYYLACIVLVAFATLIGEAIKRYIEPTNIVMLYLLTVVFVASRWGRGHAVFTSILSVLVFDFFLIPPYLTFAVDDLQYIFTFVGLLIVAIIVSELTIKIREHSEKARQLELLQAKEKLQTAVLNSISHDLRTPLASIIGSISMLLQDAPSLDEETIKELLQDAYGESNRLNRIVGNLLDMARMEAGALKIIPQLCDLRDIVGVSLEELKHKIQNRAVNIEIPRDLPEINVDFSWIVKVLVNLIDNALKYSPDDSPLLIGANVQGGEIRVKVTDQGMGIDIKESEQIFEKFYRSSKSKQIGGLGLGLSICKGIIEAHYGKIWIESRLPQKGSVVIFSLPMERP